MGKALATVFGGSGSKNKSSQTSTSSSNNKSASWNDAFPYLKETYGGAVEKGGQATDFLSALLGMNGSPAASQAFDDYKDSSGYDFTMDSGVNALNHNSASRGLFNSGAAGKDLIKFGQGTGSQFFNNFLDRLLGLSDRGLAAGSLISGAGGKSMGEGSSSGSSYGSGSGSSYTKPGIGQFLGQALQAAAG